MKEQITAEAVAQAIMHRINTGQYAPGDRLPTVRKLAEELGSNRNTVNKAYQMLFVMGLIKSGVEGYKGYSVKRDAQTGTKPKEELLEYFHQQSVELVWKGMAAGISSDEMLDQLATAVSEVFGQSRVDLVFYECNDHDTVEMGRRLIEVLGMPVDYQNLLHFYKNPAAVVERYDLVITTYHHLAEINETLRSFNIPPGRVVGIDTRITADTMLRIARFPKTHIGVVCTNQNTAHMLKHILYGYHPEWEIEAIPITDRAALQSLARNCDHLIVTHTAMEEVHQLTNRMPDVVANFQIDEQSIAFLNQRINQIRMERMKPLQARATLKTMEGQHA